MLKCGITYQPSKLGVSEVPKGKDERMDIEGHLGNISHRYANADHRCQIVNYMQQHIGWRFAFHTAHQLNWGSWYNWIDLLYTNSPIRHPKI